MKTIQHALPCGRVIFFKEVTLDDMCDSVPLKREMLKNHQELQKLVSMRTAGRNKNTWTKRTYSKFTNLLLEKLVDHLMKSDRIETAPGRYWFIGGRQSKKYVNWHSDGYSYAIRISGVDGSHGIIMNKTRRMELKKRIESGQQFHLEF